MKIYLLFMFLFLFLFGTLIAGTIDPNVSDQKYIEYGKHFPYVGQLCGTYENKTLFCASAVVLKPNYIITAAHVVEGYKSCTITIKNKSYVVESLTWPTEFKSNIFGENDLAVGFIKEAIKLDFYPELYEKEDEIGKVCCIAGYGFTGSFFTGAKTFDTKRRGGSNIIEEIEKQLLICRPSKQNDHTRTSLEFLIASGDSGGGLFIDGKLAGINSCVSGIGKDSTNSTYNSESGHTRISIHRKWILKNIRD